VKKGCELFHLGFADRALAMEDLGGYALGAEHFPETLLRKIAGLHQMLQRLLWTGLGNGMPPFLIIVDQQGQQFRQLLLFRAGILEFVEAQQFGGEVLAFLVRANDVWQRSTHQLAIHFFVHVHRFA
jgi:hypothetical protein